jgi:hypothetical protein
MAAHRDLKRIIAPAIRSSRSTHRRACGSSGSRTSCCARPRPASSSEPGMAVHGPIVQEPLRPLIDTSLDPPADQE